MAIVVTTTNPGKLLLAIQQSIEDLTVETWEKDADSDFTSTQSELKNRAWLRPRVDENALVLRLVGPEKSKIDAELYGAFHAQFVQILLTHFSAQISAIAVTPKISKDDNFNPA